ncbi:MAG TPA: hypothetical protein VFR39_06395 [Burkholderiales bacterium]|nr:hypothetical protein [Burkholderiales bacterium]
MLDFESATLAAELLVCFAVGYALKRAKLENIFSIPLLMVTAWALPTASAYLFFALGAAPKTFGYGEIYFVYGLAAGLLGRYLRFSDKEGTTPKSPNQKNT